MLSFRLTFGCCLVQQGRDIQGLIGPLLVGPPLQFDWEICLLHSWKRAFLSHGIRGRLEWSFLGRAEVYEPPHLWVLAFEIATTPFGCHKFSGGLSVAFVGYQLQYDSCQVGISDRRGRWLLEWIDKAQANSFVVASRDFAEFLGRLGFVSQVLVWIKPHLYISLFHGNQLLI